jgi:hypothetical protein
VDFARLRRWLNNQADLPNSNGVSSKSVQNHFN